MRGNPVQFTVVAAQAHDNGLEGRGVRQLRCRERSRESGLASIRAAPRFGRLVDMIGGSGDAAAKDFIVAVEDHRGR